MVREETMKMISSHAFLQKTHQNKGWDDMEVEIETKIKNFWASHDRLMPETILKRLSLSKTRRKTVYNRCASTTIEQKS